MTKTKGNLAKAAFTAILAIALMLSVFAGLGVLGASADGDNDSDAEQIQYINPSKIKIISTNTKTAKFVCDEYTPLTDKQNDDNLSGKRFQKADVTPTDEDYAAAQTENGLNPTKFFDRKFGYKPSSNTFNETEYNAYDQDTLKDFWGNFLINGHTVVEWWNGVDDGNGGKTYRMINMHVSNNEGQGNYFDFSSYRVIGTAQGSEWKPATWDNKEHVAGDTVTLKKGMKLCSKQDGEWKYYKKNGKTLVLDRDMVFKFVPNATAGGNGTWVVDGDALSEQAETIAYKKHGAVAPSVFDIVFETDKFTPFAKGTARASSDNVLVNQFNVSHEAKWKEYHDSMTYFYDNILINGKTPWEWIYNDGVTIGPKYGIHISHDKGIYDIYGGDFIQIANAGGAAFEEGDTIEFKQGFMPIEIYGGDDNWLYYANDNGKRVKTAEKLMFQLRNGKWVKTDLDAIRDGVDANGKITLSTPEDKKYNLAVTVGDGLFTNTVGDNEFKGTNFENKRSDVKYSDFFDNILFNGATAEKWYTDGVGGKKANFNIHVTADGLKISKKAADGSNIDFAVNDTVRFVGGFSFPSFDNNVWGFYTNAQGKRVVVKNTVEYKFCADGTWKKSFGVFKALEFETLPEDEEPVVAMGATVTYAATAVKVNPDDQEEATVLYSSSDDAIASVSSTGVVTGKAVGYATITATIESESGITNSYEIFVYNADAKPADGLISNGKIYIPMGKSNGEYYITDPLDKGIKALGYKVEEVTGANYDYKITVNANLYTNSRRPKDLILPVYYGKGGGAKGDVMLTDGTGKTANKNSGYLLAASDVDSDVKASNGTDTTDAIEWKTAHELALSVKKTSGEALVTFAAYLPAAPAYHGVFGEVTAKAHKLGEFKALVVLQESESADTVGKFLAARQNETGDCLFDYGQWNQNLNGGKGKWIAYGVKGASDHVDGSLWKGWNNFQHTVAAYYNNVKDDFFDKILINGKTHKVYSAEQHVDFNIHMRSEYLQLRQYGADGQPDKGTPRQWADGTTIEFLKGFRLIEKHKDGIEGKDNNGKQIECTVCYLHEDTGKYWTLKENQKFVYSAATNSWLCYNDIKEVTLDKTEVTLKPGETVQLTAQAVKAVEGSDMVSDALTYSSSDETVATVSDSGLITAADKEGTAIITVTAADGTTATCTVTVSATGAPSDSEGGEEGCGCGSIAGGGISSLIIGALLLAAACIAVTFARKKNKRA